MMDGIFVTFLIWSLYVSYTMCHDFDNLVCIGDINITCTCNEMTQGENYIENVRKILTANAVRYNRCHQLSFDTQLGEMSASLQTLIIEDIGYLQMETVPPYMEKFHLENIGLVYFSKNIFADLDFIDKFTMSNVTLQEFAYDTFDNVLISKAHFTNLTFVDLSEDFLGPDFGQAPFELRPWLSNELVIKNCSMYNVQNLDTRYFTNRNVCSYKFVASPEKNCVEPPNVQCSAAITQNPNTAVFSIFILLRFLIRLI